VDEYLGILHMKTLFIGLDHCWGSTYKANFWIFLNTFHYVQNIYI